MPDETETIRKQVRWNLAHKHPTVLIIGIISEEESTEVSEEDLDMAVEKTSNNIKNLQDFLENKYNLQSNIAGVNYKPKKGEKGFFTVDIIVTKDDQKLEKAV
jgi:FKBP-type peptidyl-prolyl cis-trans isomerase (trigger factor)